MVAHTGDPGRPTITWENPFRPAHQGSGPEWHDDEIGVGACIDTGHFHGAGADTLGAIRHFGRRIVSVHLKDHLGKVSVGIGRAALDQAIRFDNEAGRLGQQAGVSVNVHPHSHHGSLLESAEEHHYLVDRLDPSALSLGPDTGHFLRGGQDLLACLREHRDRMTHLHRPHWHCLFLEGGFDREGRFVHIPTVRDSWG